MTDQNIQGKIESPPPSAPPINLHPLKKLKRKKSLFARVFAFFGWAALFTMVWVLLMRFLPAPFTFLMVQRAIEGDKIKYHPVGISKINRNLIDAAIAAEDARFCLHDGFEWNAMNRAMAANKRGKKLRGASTISQQTAKNVFLWPARSYIRKGFEAGFTVLIEFFWPKRAIMEKYLNVAEMGDGVFGAQAAARYYFKKDAKDLTLSEASRIVAVLPSPQKWKVKSSNYVARRASNISRGAIVVRDNGLDKCVYK